MDTNVDEGENWQGRRDVPAEIFVSLWNLVIEIYLGFGNWNLEPRGVIRGRMRCFILFLGLSEQVLGAGLSPYADLIVSDFPRAARNGVRGTYLGTNGYQFQFKGHALLVDPY